MRLSSYPSVRFLMMILLSGIWTLVVPGVVAYNNGVYYGKYIKERIPDSVVISHLIDSRGSFETYPRDITKKQQIAPTKVVFSGFGDNRLNFIWFTSYSIMLLYVFVIKRNVVRKKTLQRGAVFGVLLCLLFHAPNWYRNTELGKVGRTIYSFVNLDIDPPSFYLQEARAFLFCLLLGLIWTINEQNKIDQRKALVKAYRNYSEKTIIRLSIRLRKTFFEWQRDTALITVLFVPWTWFYWQNIAFYGDHRYIFAAIIFHSFWIVSIILTTIPLTILGYGWWKLKMARILHTGEGSSIQSKQLDLIYRIDPIPKGQIFLSSLTTVISIVSPFVQIIFKK